MPASRAAPNRQNHSAPRRINLPETHAARTVFRQSRLLKHQKNTLQINHLPIVHGRLIDDRAMNGVLEQV